jgi:nitrate reductase NapE component
MHTSDQLPENQQEQDSQQPFYEFPADYPSQDAPSEEIQADPPHPPSDEEILRGLVYPPPPSFYQKAAVAEDKPETQLPPAFSPAPANSLPPGQAYAPGVQPPFAQPPVRRSRKWIWIVVAVLSIGLLGGCGLCGWAFYNVVGPAFGQATNITTLVTNYYDAIKAHDYARAYSYVSPEGVISDMTQQKFIQQARSFDTQFGSVLDFTLQNPTVTTSSDTSDIDTFSLTVQVTREKTSYNVLLTLHKVNGQWKITDFDRI